MIMVLPTKITLMKKRPEFPSLFGDRVQISLLILITLGDLSELVNFYSWNHPKAMGEKKLIKKIITIFLTNPFIYD